MGETKKKMINQYKYISKPYTLDELVNGNPIFKIYCDFFNDIYEWEQEQNVSIDSDFISIDHLELVFNEFLNILSLLHYDKLSYNNTFKHITLKLKEIEKLSYLMSVIPNILENCYFLSDPEMAEKVEKFNLKTNYYKIDNNESNSEMDVEENLLKIAKKHSENLENVLIEKNIHDLINFFDLSQINMINDASKALLSKGKRKINTPEFISIKSESIKSLDTSLQVLLFEELMTINNWEQISSNKKGKILSLLLSKNDSNVKKVYLELEKNPSKNTIKFLEDRKKASEILKEILG